MTLVTVGGLARRARRQARARRPIRSVPVTVQSRFFGSPRFTADEHRILSEASALLASSLDYDDTLERIASLGASLLADWCVVYVSGPDDHGR
ncbi:MAG: hypothetical protein ACRD26_06650, partial [Vicinamibacterales bacterium]